MEHPWIRLAGFILAIAGALLGLLSCTPYSGDADLFVTITAQPQGGTGVNTVSCTFTGEAIDKDPNLTLLSQEIDLKSVWHSTHGTYNEERFTWAANHETRTLTVSKSAPPGAHLDKDFWLELTWADARGNHTLKSEVAQCR